MLAARGSIPSISSFWKTFCRYCLQRSRNKKFSCWYFYICFIIHIILEEIPSNFTNFNLQWIVMRAKKNTCEEFFKHGTFFLTESENNKHTSVIIVRTETFRSHIVNTTKCFQKLDILGIEPRAASTSFSCMLVKKCFMEGLRFLPQRARHICSARYDSGALKRGLSARAMMARGWIFSQNCQGKHMERWIFSRAHFCFGAHDISHLSRKLQMKKVKWTIQKNWSWQTLMNTLQ